jgi:lipoprotein-anchoring transpeptidase ErfK/SrfK
VRNRLGGVVALSLAVGMIWTSAAAAEDPAESTTTTTTVTTTTVTTTTTAPVVAETTTTTTVVADTTTTAAPATGAGVSSGAGRASVGAILESTDGVLAQAERGPQIQLTPPPTPPPTTAPPPPPPNDQLPENSGTGRRAVYSKSLQRVWTVEADGSVSKTHLVSGRRTWNQPLPGTYSVFSRSPYTCNIKDPSICWRYMVRFTKGPEGDNIGFHEIPNKNGRPVQSIWQLGQALSSGCVRQATPDAQYMWNWAPVGTKVVVLP